MRRISLALVAAVAAVGSVQIASAADLSVQAPVYKGPAAVIATYNWTGWYAGANAGYSWGRSHSDFTHGPATGFGAGPCTGGCAFSLSTKPKGFIGGGQVGYNYQTGMVVWGIEADFDFRSRTDSSTIVFNAFLDNDVMSSTQKWVSTVRGRIGVTPAANWLLYATGGPAFGRFEHTVTQTFCNGPGAACNPARAFTDSVTKTGWTLGAGVDYALDRNWSVGSYARKLVTA